MRYFFLHFFCFFSVSYFLFCHFTIAFALALKQKVYIYVWTRRVVLQLFFFFPTKFEYFSLWNMKLLNLISLFECIFLFFLFFFAKKKKYEIFETFQAQVLDNAFFNTMEQQRIFGIHKCNYIEHLTKRTKRTIFFKKHVMFGKTTNIIKKLLFLLFCL